MRTARRSGRPRFAGRVLPAALLLLFVAACADTGRFDGQVSAVPSSPKLSETTGTVAREHQRILASYGGAYDNPRLEALVNQMVDRLVAASERPDQRYKVTILNSPAVNAFALPSGQLYLTRGLIALANDTAELASVLSHEMAHVIARHASTREDQVRQAALVSRVAADVFNDPQMGALALAKSKIAIASFSRGQELEADSIGVGISSRAGYDPYGAVRLLTAMGRNADLKPAATGSGNDTRHPDFLSSHPSTPERVRTTQANARQFSAPGSGERDRDAYLGAIDALVYGEDSSQGFVRGRRFLHPKLGFTFQAPEGFILDNTAQAVLGVKESGGEALRLDVVRVPGEQSLTEYLASGWIDNVDTGSIQEQTINGFPAATATARGDQWNFRLYVVRFGSEVFRFIFASKRRLTDDRSFREAVGTFRRMTLSEIEAARPLRLRIVQVQPGDTAERMASRMASIDRPLERFLLLNGLQAGQPLKVGEQVKIVVE